MGGREWGEKERNTHPHGELGATSFHRKAREMEAQTQVDKTRARPFGAGLQVLVSGSQTSPLRAKDNTWDGMQSDGAQHRVFPAQLVGRPWSEKRMRLASWRMGH